ncbi:hypothetical protein KEM55_001921 [Ascosphaera atra]|nr:hypothetical protein KEM55_001921 [Ascosphaera atra]
MWDAAREAGLFEGEEWFSVIDSFGMTGANARQRLTAASSAELVDQGIPQQSIQLLPFIPCIITKLGPNGVLLTQMLASDDPRLRAPEHARHVLGRAAPPREGVNKAGGIYMRHFPPAGKLAAQEIVSVNGVGDTLLGVLVAGLARNADDQHLQCLETIIPVAQRASIETLKSPQAVSPRISGLLEELKAGEQKK